MKFINKLLKYIKPIFSVGVMILIILEFSKLRKEISADAISRIFYDLGPLKIISLLIMGFIAFSPMLNYDFSLSKYWNIEKDKVDIAKKSIIINSFNNLIGFGGIINIGLRMKYFGEDREAKSLLKFLLKSFLFNFTGISALSLISTIFLVISKSEILINYKLILIGGILYFPITLSLLFFKNEKLPISKDYAIRISLTSFFEWGLAALFFASIGYVLGIKLKLLTIISVFIIANIFGILSFIPGGIGSMDLVAITCFSSLGFDKDLIVTWVLIYRIFYYITPFILGFILFARDLGSVFDEKKDNIPSSIIKSIAHDTLSIMLYILGIFLIISVVAPEEISKISVLKEFSPASANLIYQFPSLILGYGFILLGRANKEKVKKSTSVTLIYLVITFIYFILQNFGLIKIIYITICMMLTFITKKVPYREQLVYSMEDITIDGIIYIIVSALTVILVTFNYVIVLENDSDFIIIPFEKNFIAIGLGLLIIFGINFILLNYLKGEKKKLGESLDREKVLKIIKENDGTSDIGLALVGDKEIYYYYEDEIARAAISIYTIRDRVIVMGDAFGDETCFENLLDNFIKEADIWGYTPIFYEIEESQTIKLHDYGFSFIKFGEKASVYLEDFNLEGSKHKTHRNILSRFKKDNIEFEIVNPPYSGEFMNEIKKVSDSWLEGRREKGFSLGFFNDEYIKNTKIAIVKKEDKIVAFANIMPNAEKTWASIDLMRFDREKAPKSVMEFLFLNLFLHEKEFGRKKFGLGMAPLANVGINSNSFIEEKLAYFVYKFGFKFYSFEGLRSYKEKFSPSWTPVYLSYSRKTWLLYNVITLFFVDIIAVKKIKKDF